MKFSTFTTSTPEWTVEESAQKLSEQGWDGIEWGVNDFPPSDVPSFRAGNRAVWPLETLERDLPRIRQITEQNGLGYSAIAAYAKSHERDTVERVLRATAEIGAERVRVSAPHVRSRSYHELLEITRHDYEWVAQRAAHYGVKALLEIHHRIVTASVSGTMQIISDLDPAHIGVIYDTGNLVIEGQEDYLWSLEQLGDYLGHVHVKNAVWVPDPEPGPADSVIYNHQWAPLRKGQANLPRFFEALVKIGYGGWVTVEDFTTELPLEERTADNLAYLQALHIRATAMDPSELLSDEGDPMISYVRP